jgi:hypothetical protein
MIAQAGAAFLTNSMTGLMPLEIGDSAQFCSVSK